MINYHIKINRMVLGSLPLQCFTSAFHTCTESRTFSLYDTRPGSECKVRRAGEFATSEWAFCRRVDVFCLLSTRLFKREWSKIVSITELVASTASILDVFTYYYYYLLLVHLHMLFCVASGLLLALPRCHPLLKVSRVSTVCVHTSDVCRMCERATPAHVQAWFSRVDLVHVWKACCFCCD